MPLFESFNYFVDDSFDAKFAKLSAQSWLMDFEKVCQATQFEEWKFGFVLDCLEVLDLSQTILIALVDSFDNLARFALDFDQRVFDLARLQVNNLIELPDFRFWSKNTLLVCQISYVEHDALPIVENNFIALETDNLIRVHASRRQVRVIFGCTLLNWLSILLRLVYV